MEQVFHRNLKELESVFDFLEHHLPGQSIGERNAFAVKFVVEELFTNMVKYGRGSTGNITMKIHRSKESCVVTMIDDDVDRFDVTKPPDVNISQPIQERTPGGLGIYLINKIVDSIDYTYENRQSVITFSKRLE